MSGETHRTTPHSNALAHDSVPTLLHRLATDVMELVGNEFALARSEFAEAVIVARRALASTGLAAALLMSGLMAMIAGTVLLLMRWVPPWLAATIIGILFVAGGLLLLRREQGRAHLKNLSLTRTRRSVRNDIDVIRRRGA